MAENHHDLLGRTIRTERPGFSFAPFASFVVTNASFYNSIGQLARTTAPGQADTLNVYDELGNLILSGLDINGNGALDLAGPDRVTENQPSYWYGDPGLPSRSLGEGWWQVSTSMLYPVDGSAAPTTNSVQYTLLSGLGGSVGAGILSSESVSQDILGNQTVSQTVIDRGDKIVTQTTVYPDSTNAAVSVNFNGLAEYSVSKTGVRTDAGYDALARQVSSQQSSLGGLRTTGSFTHYNVLGQVDWTMDAASNQTSFVYESATGRRVATFDAFTNGIFTAYDSWSRVIATWGATYPVGYTFDTYGRMVAMQTTRNSSLVITNASAYSLQPSAFDTTQWLFDQATGLLTNKVYADGKGPVYSYTPQGQLATRTWARLTSDLRPLTSTYSYSLLTGEMTNIVYSDSTPAVSFTFNRLGQQVAINDGTGARNFTYNDFLQLVAETNVFCAIQRSYDSLGRSAGFSLFNPGNPVNPVQTIAYGYSDIGRFSSVTSAVGSVTSVSNYSYLPGSDLLAGWANNASFSVARTYEPNRDLLTSVTNAFGGAPLPSYAYVSDALGRRVSRQDSVGEANSFGYNIRSELVGASMGTNQYGYAYDPIGNRMVATNNAEAFTYAANALNQYTNILEGAAPSAPLYDLDGNLTNYNGWTFTWDAENRLIAAVNGSTVVSNCYDFMSRRVSKTVNGDSRQFVYDGWNLAQEDTAAGTNAYVWGLNLSGSLQGAGGIGGLLCATLNGTQAFYFFDANGNVSDLADVSGNNLAHYEYDPYGNIAQQSGSEASANPFRFSSKYTDDETGLLYYGFRFYNPVLGRWASRDPIEENGGWNIYGFVNNRTEDAFDDLEPLLFAIVRTNILHSWVFHAMCSSQAVTFMLCQRVMTSVQMSMIMQRWCWRCSRAKQRLRPRTWMWKN